MNRVSKYTVYGILLSYILIGFYFGYWRTERIVKNDVIIYYEYLTAAYMFNDLSFDFAFELPDDFDGDIWLEKGSDGAHFPKMTMGVAVMITPFYWVPFIVNELFDMGSYGYSSFFQFFVFIAALFYAGWSLLILRRILLKYFEDLVVTWTLIGVFMATNLAYYVCAEPGMSHIYSFFLFVALLDITIKWHDHPNLKHSLFLGLILGLIFLVRPTNVVVAFIPLFYGVWNLRTFKSKWLLLKKNLSHFSLVIITGAVVCSLQFMFWKYSTNSWVIYGYSDEGFFWNDPEILKGLFSFRKGWFVYTPIMVLSMIGILLFFNQKLKEFRVASVLFIVLNLYVIFSWWCWWYGGSFGQRALIESYGILALFLATFIFFAFNNTSKLIKRTAQIILVGFVCLNLFQMKQYSTSLLHWDSMNFTTYKAIFGKTKFPDNYSEMIDPPDYESAMEGDR